jgi:hypothetical protein
LSNAAGAAAASAPTHKLSIDCNGMPRGTKTAHKGDDGLFKEVKLTRGRPNGSGEPVFLMSYTIKREVSTDHDSFVFESDAAMRRRTSSRLSRSRFVS